MGFFSDVFNNGISFTTGGLSDMLGITDAQTGMQQQDDANAKAMQAWQIANDYNHPIKQMERLKAAGLNPNLVYGSGSVAGNTSGAPSLVGGQFKTGAESAISGLSNAVAVWQGQANVNNTIAQTGAHNAAAAASGAQASNLNAQTAINEKKAQYEEKSLIADIDYKQALAKKTAAEADIAQGEADLFGVAGGAKGVQAAGGLANAVKSVGKFARGILK